MGQRVRRAFSEVFDVSMRSDREIASLLQDLEIDIAVDLNGFTGAMRSEIFAYRAVPIQVNYLGFPGTMGAPYIDYIIADEFVIPPAYAQFYSEQVVYLPDCFQASDDRRPVGGRAPTRAEEGLAEESFVFCSFNNSYKINPPLFDVWMRLLERVPGSTLWLLAGNETVRKNLLREAQIRGVDGRRLVFAERRSYESHLARLPLADLFLDSVPFNAGATAGDALWAGLPVLTCAGEAFAARMAGSLLRATGMPELITHSLQAYESTALKLAASTSELQALRARLVSGRDRLPLFDTDRFRRHLEAAYEQMWQRYQRHESPQQIKVRMLS
jgi:predicted O-linked N-acetylglucosamine transferase (SPINDLY family)